MLGRTVAPGKVICRNVIGVYCREVSINQHIHHISLVKAGDGFLHRVFAHWKDNKLGDAVIAQPLNIAPLLAHIVLAVRKNDLVIVKFGAAFDTDEDFHIKLIIALAQHDTNSAFKLRPRIRYRSRG